MIWRRQPRQIRPAPEGGRDAALDAQRLARHLTAYVRTQDPAHLEGFIELEAFHRQLIQGERRARRLLEGHLTAMQLDTMQLNGWFEVRGSATGCVYRIHVKKYLGNVWDIRGNKKYCIALVDRSLPTSDHVLAQKLLLETNEAAFLRTANVTRLS